jgi:hypothetical protein
MEHAHMAKYIVKATIQTLEKGKKLVLKPGAEPQEVPKGLVKELLAKSLIEEVALLARLRRPMPTRVPAAPATTTRATEHEQRFRPTHAAR